MDTFSPDIVKEIRRLNNISESSSSYEASVKILHLFFTHFLPIDSITAFSNLVELVLIGIQVKSLSFLKFLPNLNKLWLCEGGLKSMQGIENAKNLEELVLFDNKICEIEGLNSMTFLQRLWLNDNEITSLSGIEKLSTITDLNLAGNKITKLHGSLSSLKGLETLNLSGNPLYDFQDILFLSHLMKLKSLFLNDPQYPPSILNMQNYTLLALVHYLPQLNCIDGICLDRNFRSLIDSIIRDKKFFNFSKFRHKHNEILNNLTDLEMIKNDAEKNIVEKIRLLDLKAKSVESQVDRVPRNDGIHLRKSLRMIREQIASWKDVLEKMKFQNESPIKLNLRRCLHSVELQMFGSLSIDRACRSSEILKCCDRFIQARICWHDKALEAFSEMRLINVWRIQNDLLNKQCLSISTISYELLFYNGIFSTDSELCYLGDVLRRGFSAREADNQYRFTSLVNKLIHFKKEPARRLLNRTFNILVVRVLKRDSNNCIKAPIILPINNDFLADGNQKFCACSLAHFKLDFKDCNGIIPEFIAEIEVISKNPHNLDVTMDMNEPKSLADIPNPKLGRIIHSNRFLISAWKKLGSLTELNLFGTRFHDLQGLKELFCLRNLGLSNCNLTTLKGLSLNLLENLDVSHNSISSLEGLGPCPSLKFLNANWNLLCDMEEEFKIISRITKNLVDVQFEFNPWINVRNPNEFAQNLTRKDGNISEYKTAELWRNHLFSQTTKVLLTLWPVKNTILNFKIDQIWKNSKLFASDSYNSLRTLYINHANLTNLNSLNGLEQLEELSIEGNSITSLQGINQFKNLHVLLAGDNQIKTISDCGLKGLKNLQVLALDKNEISSLIPLKYCYSLQQLYVSGNRLSDYLSLLTLKSIPDLKVLDMRYNPMKRSLTQHRLKTIYNLPRLHYLDGKPVTSLEIKESKSYFEGRLMTDLLLATLDIETPNALDHINFDNQNVKTIELMPVESFLNLHTVNLSNNSLTSFEGLLELRSLKVLWLPGNNIFCFHPSDLKGRFLPNLKVLSLERNGIKSLLNLHLNRLPSLETIFLQSNALTTMSGLTGLVNLKYLVLDHNRIQNIHPKEIGNLSGLLELHLDGNRLRDIPVMENLSNLKHLYLSGNRLDKLECILHKLKALNSLSHLSLYGNSFSNMTYYRIIVLKHLTKLKYLDGNKFIPAEIEASIELFKETDGADNEKNLLNTPIRSYYQSAVNGQCIRSSLDVKTQQINSDFPTILTSTPGNGGAELSSHGERSKSRLNPNRVPMALPGISINALAHFDS